MSDTEKTSDDVKFEDALARLESLVARMESGKVPLENLISDFEQGSKLVALCRSRLDAMERRIQLLTRDDGQSGEWSDFEPDAPEAKSDDKLF